MKRILTLFILPLIPVFMGSSAQTQTCSDGRYVDSLFDVSVTQDVVYGENINVSGDTTTLKMDVYEPANDQMQERPLVFFTHGGSFISGDKGEDCVVRVCKDLAEMGYVAVSINYRIGMEDFPFPGPDSVDATESVWRATHDARAAVRFFRKDAAENGNTYGIDPNQIFFGGLSAGAITTLHLGYLDRMSEVLVTGLDTSKPGLGGGVAGNSGNPGYSWNVTALFSVSGAIGDSAWMEPGDIPLVSFHGDNDGTVPYGSDTIDIQGNPLLQVDGSASIKKRADHIGVPDCFTPYPGEGHTPECNKEAYYDSTLTITKHFLLRFVCNEDAVCSMKSPVGIQERKLSKGLVEVRPNPAGSELRFSFPEKWANSGVDLTLYDLTGREVREKTIRSAAGNGRLQRKGLEAGVYLLSLQSAEGTVTRRVVFE